MRFSLSTVRTKLTALAGAVAVGTLLAACSGGGGTGPSTPPAQTPSTSQQQPTPPTTGSTASGSSETVSDVSISPSDASAAKSATGLTHHILPVAFTSSGSKGTSAATPPTVQYPEDLGYAGGPLVKSETSENIYLSVGTTPSNRSIWGDPRGFLANLGKSTFIHVTDQYTHVSGSYLPGDGAHVTSTNLSYGPLYDNDLLAIIHAVAKGVKKSGETGYERIYDLFLPPGVDTCISFSTQCYSPDNLSTFAFCAYHSSVTFPDIGHVLYTIEPYQPAQVMVGTQQVSACSNYGPTTDPNFVADATDSTLSHETFETITDPDPPTGWTVPFSNGGVAGGYEIGDLCAYAPSETTALNGELYLIQPEYSNIVHGCVNDDIQTAAVKSKNPQQ